MASLSSPFTYEAAKVIFGSIYLHLHLQTVLNLQDLFELKKVDISTDTTLHIYHKYYLFLKQNEFPTSCNIISTSVTDNRVVGMGDTHTQQHTNIRSRTSQSAHF